MDAAGEGFAERSEVRAQDFFDVGSTKAVQPRHGVLARRFAAIVCGVVAGALIPSALAAGSLFYFPEERQGANWVFLWGEHWAIRVAASCASAVAAGFIAGVIARDRGRLCAAIAAIPSTLCWLAIVVIGWTGKVPFLARGYDVDISIGNKLAASLLVLTVIPFAVFGGAAGQEEGQLLGEHFDSRRFTLLGIKWYHYLWLPIVIQVLLTQTTWALLYGFEWLRNTWRAGIGLTSIIPLIFASAIWWTLSLTIDGATKAYRVLSGLEGISPASRRALAVLKYGIGFPILAAVLQAAISLLHYGMLKVLHIEPSPGG